MIVNKTGLCDCILLLLKYVASLNLSADVKMFPNTIVLHLDFHKLLRTPKCPEQDSYCTVKVITHLFGIYCGNEDKLYCFFYEDSIGGTGPNEVIS